MDEHFILNSPGDSTPWGCSDLHLNMYLSATCARHVFQVLMGTLVPTSGSSDSGVLLQRFSPARPHQEPPPGESPRSQAGKKKCNQEESCFSWWKLLKTTTLEGLSTLGQLQQSTKHQAGESLEREMVKERPKAVLQAPECFLLYAQSTLISELDNFEISLRISIDEGQIISCQHLTSFPKTTSSGHGYAYLNK